MIAVLLSILISLLISVQVRAFASARVSPICRKSISTIGRDTFLGSSPMDDEVDKFPFKVEAGKILRVRVAISDKFP